MIRKDEGGLFMEVALVIGMFVCTALALNFLVNGRRKLSGTFEIINLCLIVATAYQFKLVSSIIWVLVILAILLIAGLIFNKKRKDKNPVVEQAYVQILLARSIPCYRLAEKRNNSLLRAEKVG